MNFKELVKKETDVDKLVDVLFSKSMGKYEPNYWIEGEKLILSAIIMYVREALPYRENNFRKVYELLSQIKVYRFGVVDFSGLDALFDSVGGTAKKRYEQFKIYPNSNIESVLLGLTVLLREIDVFVNITREEICTT